MTAVDERTPLIDLATDRSSSDATSVEGRVDPAPPSFPGEAGPSSTAAGEAEVRTLKVARFAATVIMALIAAACFVLSFSSLWDLASRSVSWPRHLAWLWPLIVDGVVVVATIAIRALTRTAAATEEGLLIDRADRGGDRAQVQHRHDRTFFWWMLIAAASVSVAGNGLHSFLPPGQPLSPWLSVVIGCVPACALLATTHALQRLSRLRIRPPAEVNDSAAEVFSARAAAVAELRAGKWHAVAASIHERGLLVHQSTETLVTAMTYLFEVKPTPSLRAIAGQMGLAHHDMVSRVRDAALLVLSESAGQ
jgi:Protein of unknown function (DUF2637)